MSEEITLLQKLEIALELSIPRVQRILFIIGLSILLAFESISNLNSELLLRQFLDNAVFFIAYYNLITPIWIISPLIAQSFLGKYSMFFWGDTRFFRWVEVFLVLITNSVIYSVAAYYAHQQFYSF